MDKVVTGRSAKKPMKMAQELELYNRGSDLRKNTRDAREFKDVKKVQAWGGRE